MRRHGVLSFDRATIRDVAELAGVSAATVSKVMNKTGRISAETEQRVRFVIAVLDYTPNVHARELRRRSLEPGFT